MALLLCRNQGTCHKEDGKEERTRRRRGRGGGVVGARRRGEEGRRRGERAGGRRGGGRGRKRRHILYILRRERLAVRISTNPKMGNHLFTVPTTHLQHVVPAETLVRAASLRVFRKSVQQYLVVHLRQQQKRQQTRQHPLLSYTRDTPGETLHLLLTITLRSNFRQGSDSDARQGASYTSFSTTSFLSNVSSRIRASTSRKLPSFSVLLFCSSDGSKVSVILRFCQDITVSLLTTQRLLTTRSEQVSFSDQTLSELTFVRKG